MKYLCLLAGVLATTSTASAVSLTLANNFSIGFTDNRGDVIPNGTGFFSAGIFSEAPTVENISSAFTPLSVGGTAQFLPFSATNNFDGFAQGVVNGGRQAAGSPFVGQPIFVVYGNGSDVASSNQFAVLATGSQFDADDSTVTESNISFQATLASAVVGVSGGNIPLGTQTRPTIQLVAVPEPSTALLGMIGIVGLLRRRR